MKTISLSILIILIGFKASSQDSYRWIRINSDIELIKLSKNIYVHVSISELPEFGRFPSNGMLLVDEKKAILFDTPMNDSLTQQLVTFIQDSMKLQIVGFVPNHWHRDCMGGLKYLQSIGVKSYANILTIETAKSKNLPVPQNGFRDSLKLSVGTEEAICYYLGAGHTKDNIVVWIPSEKILFAGCMVKEMASKGLGNITDADLKEWPITLSKVLEKFNNAKVVIPGHGQIGDTRILKHSIALFENIK